MGIVSDTDRTGAQDFQTTCPGAGFWANPGGNNTAKEPRASCTSSSNGHERSGRQSPWKTLGVDAGHPRRFTPPLQPGLRQSFNTTKLRLFSLPEYSTRALLALIIGIESEHPPIHEIALRSVQAATGQQTKDAAEFRRVENHANTSDAWPAGPESPC